MTMRFSLEHASLVGWLTRRDFPAFPMMYDWTLWEEWHYYRHRRMEDRVEGSALPWRAPRVLLRVLRGFLEALPESVLTREPEDRESLRRLVRKSREILDEVSGSGQHDQLVASTDVARILAPVRQWFDLPFYFLPVGSGLSFDAFRQSPGYTLWLQCDDDRSAKAQRDLFDPFPALRHLFTSGTFAPVTVCWTASGETAIIPEKVASAENILEISRRVRPWKLWAELSKFHKAEDQSFHLLQLSDLHFGASAVTPQKLTYVEQHIRERIESVRKAGGSVQPIVTGDLMDSPSRKHLAEFESFRNRLTDYSKTNTICIPGNHDMRRKGFLWRNWEALVGLEWKSVVPSDVCKVIFVCFDTSKDAKLAQGKITNEQFLEVSTKLAELKRMRDCSDYIQIVLTHHHPFSTRDDEVDTLPFLGIREERFLRMENGDHLVQWCASAGIPLILHGHKHRPRFIGQEIECNGATRLVRAVGCGSSFGIEGKPLSFNWITWQPATKQWTVAFYSDPGDGSGFTEKRLVIGERLNNG